MRVLKVCSGNNGISPFIVEQAQSLRKLDLEVDIFRIEGSGAMGYIKYLKRLIEISRGYDIIHGHYGFSGLLAGLQIKKPVVCTYHGSDLHLKTNRKYSKLASRLSNFSILTNKKQLKYLNLREDKYSVIPCGVDHMIFKPRSKKACRQELGWEEDKNYILFSSSFDRPVKNAKLAFNAINLIEDTKLVELKNFSRVDVATAINAADMVLITSFNETGPLIAKEAWACNTPVISTDVGDVAEILKEQAPKYIVPYNTDSLVGKIKKLISSNTNVGFRQLVLPYSLSETAKKIKEIYYRVL